MIRILLAASLCLGGALRADPATAQTYPDRPIKMVVPFPAGGPTDGMARIISDRLGTVLGQSIVIENKGGGAGGSIGAKFVATSDPDGYTILHHARRRADHRSGRAPNIGYDAAKAFVPVAQLIETPLIVSGAPDLPVKTLAELVAYAKANPGKISWGSQGFGVAPHLLLELFKLETGVNIVHVPYRGTAPMLAAIVAGEVQIVADPMTTSLPHVQSGKLRALAIAGAERTSETARRADRGGGGISEAAIAVLARRRGAGRHAAADRRQAQRRIPRKPEAARRRARCSPSSAPISRSARRPSSAKCSPRSSRFGPAW